MFEIKKHHKVRVKLSHDGTAWYVALPHYNMVPDTHRPVTKGLIHKNGVDPKADPAKVLALMPTVEVFVPDRMCDTDGNLHLGKIRELYKGQKLWDHDRVVSDVLPPIEDSNPNA